MRIHLFVYGTLLFEKVRNRILHKSYSSQPATLYDYQRTCIKGAHYPGIIKHDGSFVEGLLLLDIKLDDMKRLDEYEGEYYHRIQVEVALGTGKKQTAMVYLIKPCYRTLCVNQQWNPQVFQQQYLERYLRNSI